MSRKKYILQIQHPCEEKWAEMTPNEAGRFCAHCSKTVVDFTTMNDRQIVQLLENSSEKMCGRLLNDQMNRVITDHTENTYYKFPRLVAGLLLAGTATNSIAQMSEVKTEIVSPQDSLKEIVMGKIGAPVKPKIDSTKNSIQGKVIDEDKEGIIAGMVGVVDEKGNYTKAGTTTDFDGNFNLYVPEELFNNDSSQIELKISYIGYESTKITINKKDLPYELKEPIMLHSLGLNKEIEIKYYTVGLIEPSYGETKILKSKKKHK